MISSGPSMMALAVGRANENTGGQNYLQKAGHLALASVVDFGSTVYNSLDFGNWVDDSTTAGILDGMGVSETAAFYHENRDLVEGVSFFGGMLIPGMAAIKGSMALRSGLKGSSVLSPNRTGVIQREIKQMLLEGKKGSALYRQKKHDLFKTNIGQGLVDNLAAEVAIVGALNAHPLMEDYMEELPANFMASLAFGAAIGGVIDVASTAYKFKTLAGEASAELHRPVLDLLPSTGVSLEAGTRFRAVQTSIDEMRRMVADPATAPETKIFARDQADRLAVESREFIEVVAKGLTKGDKTDIAMLRLAEDVLNNPASAGVETLEFFKLKGAGQTDGFVKRLKTVIVDTLSKEGAKGKQAQGVYAPQFNMYVSPEEAIRVGGVADTGITTHAIAAIAKKFAGTGAFRKAGDNTLDLAKNTTAQVDEMFVQALHNYDTLSLKQLMQTVVHEGDLPALSGLVAKLRTIDDSILKVESKLSSITDPKKLAAAEKRVEALKEFKATFKLNTTDGGISIDRLKTLGVKVDHVAQVQKSVKGLKQLTDELPTRLRGMIVDIAHGNPGANDVLREELSAFIETGVKSEMVEKLISSGSARAVRKRLAKHSDKRGRVHLYVNPVNAKGTAAELLVYSATKPHANARLSSVPVKGVVGTYVDEHGVTQFLTIRSTKSAARDNITGFKTDAAGVITTKNTQSIGFDEVEDFARESVARKVMSISRDNDLPMGIEEMSLRTNTSKDSIVAILGMPNTGALKETGAGAFAKSDAKSIGDYLAPTNRLLLAKDNGRLTSYYDYVKMQEAGLDRKALDEWNMSTTIDMLKTSESSMIKQLNKSYGNDTVQGETGFRAHIAMLKKGLSNINDDLAGSRFFSSSDHYVRKMGDVGKLVNHYGEKFTHASNLALNQFVQPMNQALAKVAADDAQMFVLSKMIQIHRGIGGKQVRFNNRRFETVNAVTKEWEPVLTDGAAFAIPKEMTEVVNFLNHAGKMGVELQSIRKTVSKVTGGAPPISTGFWLPNLDLKTKNVTFVRYLNSDKAPQVITGTTVEEMLEKKAAFKELHGDKVEFISPENRQQGKRLEGIRQQGLMTHVDVTQLKGGKLANVDATANLDDVKGIINSMSQTMHASSRNVHSLMFSDVLYQMDHIKGYAQRDSAAQAQTYIRKQIGDPVTAATNMKSALLGSKDQLEDYQGWNKVNSATEAMIVATMSKANVVLDAFGSLGKGKGNVARMEQLGKDLEKAGVPFPYQKFDDVNASRVFDTGVSPADARRLVAASNALTATMALRFLEVAQPLVNMMSLPIMTYSASAHKYDKSYLGYTKVGGSTWPAKHMMNGVRAMHDSNPAVVGLLKKAEVNGYFTPMVSEATEAIRLTRANEKGALSKFEGFLDSFAEGGKLEKTTKLSDMSEGLTRRAAFSTGIQLGKELYGMKEGVDDAALLIFGKDFMDRAIGNYSAAQRPVMFHGTAGAAVGLFQTYMVTFAQNMYRHVEHRQFKAIAGTLGIQGTLFGLGGLPGYDLVSKHIGENFSDNHTDLTSGLYRAVDDPTASLILYGLPSSLGGFSGRGAITPRIPILSGELPAGVNTVVDSVGALRNIGSRMMEASQGNATGVGGAFLEAVSMQSISRPLARLSELAMGHSVTRAGRTVSTPEEVYTPTGILARVLSTRPTDEVRLRNANHLNTYYGSLDRENKSKAMLRLRNAIRLGNADRDLVGGVAQDYMKAGGTATGWRSALSQATQVESTNLNDQLRRSLSAENPLVNMLNDR